MDINLRFYVSILQSFMQYLNNENKELVKEWESNIKPFLLKKYPFEQNGIFNINADIKYLIKEIDNLLKKGKNNNDFNYKNDLNSNNIHVKKNTINEKNDLKRTYYKKMEKEEKDDEDNLSPLKINNLEKEQNISGDNSIVKIKNSEDKNNNNDKKVDFQSSNTLSHSQTISNRKRIYSIYDELNENKNLIDKTKSLSINKEISPNFIEEFETEGITISHKKNDKKIISKMTFNMFLKKIVINNFYNEYIIYATNFAEQCFYFIKKEIIFKKIINCYIYYSQLKVPFNQRWNLIYFMNLLVIKMYDHFSRISSNDEAFLLIKDFYKNFTSEIKEIINKSKTTSEKIQNILVEGINAIKKGVNNINKNLKDNLEKMKNIKGNDNCHTPDNIKSNIGNEELKLDLKLKEKNLNQEIENKINNINIITNRNETDKEKEILQEEELLKECDKIIKLFETEEPKQEILSTLEKDLYIYILKVKFKIKIFSTKKVEKKKSNKSYSEKSLPLYYFIEKKVKNQNEKKNYFYILDWDTRDIGEELIYVSQSALNKIKRKELYNGAFTKKENEIKCSGIQNNINLFNKLIFFIIEDILSYDLPQTRAKIIEKWANVADYCRRRKDYNDIFVINSAFKNYIISNLFLTWKEVGSKYIKLIKEIDNFCSFVKNYKNIREDMKLLTRNDFYTPYLGLLLKDLIFFEENYKYLDDGNLINFDKINGIQSAIDKFFHFQKTVDKKVSVLHDELNFFENLETIEESYLDNLAQQLEPKFTLYLTPKNDKRLTEIDKKYFQNHVGKSKSSNL